MDDHQPTDPTRSGHTLNPNGRCLKLVDKLRGEPSWLKEPSEEYLEASGLGRASFRTHAENAGAGEQPGLDLVSTLVSSQDAWDTYEGLQWYAATEYARTHPDDPDVPELVQKVARARAAYLRWGWESLGRAIYEFRQQLSGTATPAA